MGYIIWDTNIRYWIQISDRDVGYWIQISDRDVGYWIQISDTDVRYRYEIQIRNTDIGDCRDASSNEYKMRSCDNSEQENLSCVTW